MKNNSVSFELVEGSKTEKNKTENEHKKRELPKKPRGVLLKEARKAWNDIAPVLFDMGALEKVDFPTFALMLEHYALAIKAAAAIREDGLFRRDENGVRRKHPACQVLRDNSQQYRQYIREFAVSPKARKALDLDHYFENKKNSDLEAILSGDI